MLNKLKINNVFMKKEIVIFNVINVISYFHVGFAMKIFIKCKNQINFMKCITEKFKKLDVDPVKLFKNQVRIVKIAI